MSGSPAGFELQPTLRGAHLELRPLAVTDFEALQAAASDPLIWEQHPEPDRHTPAAFRRYFDGAIASGGAFAIVDRGTGRIVGCSRYSNLRPAEREVEIGWTFLERAQWGGAANRELKSLMIGHALRFVDRVVFTVGERNERSQRALAKIGAVPVRRVEQAGPDGAPTTHVVFEITRTPLAAP